MKKSELKSLIKENIKEVLKENETQKASIKAAKILANGFGRGFSPKEFGEYVEDYFNNPEEYNIDIESDYYKAIGSKKNEAEDIKAAIGSMISEAKTKPGKITEDYDGEMVKLTSESGFVELGNIFDEDGPVEELVSIYAKDNSPQGYTAVRISDLQKLIQAYNKAEWSVGKI